MDKSDRYIILGVIIFLMIAVVVLPLYAYNNGYKYGKEIAAVNKELRTYQLSCAVCEASIGQLTQFSESLRSDLNKCIELRYEWNEAK